MFSWCFFGTFFRFCQTLVISISPWFPNLDYVNNYDLSDNRNSFFKPIQGSDFSWSANQTPISVNAELVPLDWMDGLNMIKLIVM